jgi:Skp family chaperone for outer membrane proteins
MKPPVHRPPRKETRGVNKSIVALAGAVIIGAVGLQALAQTGGKTPVVQTSASNPAPTGVAPIRTAVVNINKVLKLFNKAQMLNNSISSEVNAYGQQIQQKRDEAAKIQTELAKPTIDQATKDNLQRRLVQLEREAQDLDAEARKQITAKQGTVAIGIYKDIEGVIERVAAANGFDLVLSYPDATADTEMYTQPNVVRKLASQGAIPIYYKKHIDITDAVVQTLNATFPVAAPVQQTGGTMPATNPPTTPTNPGTISNNNPGQPKRP